MRGRTKRLAIVFALLVGVAVVIGVAAWRSIAISMAPRKRPTPSRSAAAIAADSVFWRTLHSGAYHQLPHAIEVLTRAYVATPRDAVSLRWSPSESPVLSGGQGGAHKIDGVGAGFVVPLWQEGIADQIEQVSTEEAVAMALRLAREEGLFAGTSTGGNVIAALRLAEQLGPDATIVTVMCDTGMKYLRTYGSAPRQDE